jgi:anti-sigma factor RsiW
MMTHRHAASGLLAQKLDGELTGAEAIALDDHLAGCSECRLRYEELRRISSEVTPVLAELLSAKARERKVDVAAQREWLLRKLEAEPEKKSAQSPERVLRRFGWGMAIAASLAFMILIAPKHFHTADPQRDAPSNNYSNAIEVDGVTFIALPYSNPDLPVSESRVVEMQVPVSALNDIGIVIEPVSAREPGVDRSVLADVLMGTDGQPLGVHVRE